MGELFYNHPLGAARPSSHTSIDHSQRLEEAAYRRQLARKQPLQEKQRNPLPHLQEKEGYGEEQMESQLQGTEEQ